MATTEKKTISIKRTFNQPVDKVWKAWTDPETFKKWWGPKGYTCPYATIDFKVGGKYLCAMKAPDGKETWSTGIYKEIIPHKKIVFTDSFADNKGNVVAASFYNMPGEWDKELIVTLEFEEAEGTTKMRIEQTGIPEELFDDSIAGWQQSLTKIENLN